MPPTQQIYKGIYLEKLIMAFLVVAIHTTNWTLMGLLETAVPWFFLASGFFLFGKLNGDKEKDLCAIRNWTWKVLKLYIIWTIIYLPFAVIGFWQDQLPFSKSVVVWLRNVILVGENYLSWPLWYLLALVWDGALIWLMRRIGIPLWAMCLIGLSLYLFADLYPLEEISVYARLFKTTRNGVFVGLLFVTGGGIIRQWETKNLVHNPVLWDILLVVVSFIGFQFSHLLLPALAASLFLISLRLKLPQLKVKTAILIGTVSKYVYLTHMVFAGLLVLLAGFSRGPLLYLVTVVMATLVSLLLSSSLKKTG